MSSLVSRSLTVCQGIVHPPAAPTAPLSLLRLLLSARSGLFVGPLAQSGPIARWADCYRWTIRYRQTVTTFPSLPPQFTQTDSFFDFVAAGMPAASYLTHGREVFGLYC